MNSFTFNGSVRTKWSLLLGLVLSASAAIAQETSSPIVQTLQYNAVLSNYRGYTDQGVSSWQQSHIVVEKRGGWRAYAREAGAPDGSEKPVVPIDKTGVHGEHGRKP